LLLEPPASSHFHCGFIVVAEVLNERLGNLVGDALAEIGKVEAELRRAQQDFEDEVLARAQREMAAAAGGGSREASIDVHGNKAVSAVAARSVDVEEAADNLRAEVAAAKAALQAIKRQRAEPTR
jgi:hypothetical protein